VVVRHLTAFRGSPSLVCILASGRRSRAGSRSPLPGHRLRGPPYARPSPGPGRGRPLTGRSRGRTRRVPLKRVGGHGLVPFCQLRHEAPRQATRADQPLRRESRRTGSAVQVEVLELGTGTLRMSYSPNLLVSWCVVHPTPVVRSEYEGARPVVLGRAQSVRRGGDRSRGGKARASARRRSPGRALPPVRGGRGDVDGEGDRIGAAGRHPGAAHDQGGSRSTPS